VNVLAIDQGTSSTKALVVAAGGEVLAEAEVPVATATVGDGGVEQDPEEIWSSVVEAGHRALRASGATVGAVGLANQGETILAWEKTNGRPLSRAISWQDRRSAGVCAGLSAHADELRQLTGLPLDPYFSAPKIAWLRRQGTVQGVCTTTDAWLLHRLAGTFATDAATASRTLLLDLDTVDWSPRACALFGVDAAELPRIADCAGIVGETGIFGATLPLAGIVVDQQAALFAEGCTTPGETKCTYGTGAFLLTTVGAAPVRSRAGLVACVAWRLAAAPTYCLDGQVYTAGAAVDWLRRIGLVSGAAELDAVASSARDSAGVVFVPALAGLAAPFWRPAARGVLAGLSLGAERAHLIRAFLEGIAAEVAWLARAVGEDLGRPIACLRADGGLTRSRVLMQMQADLLQAPVEVCGTPHATALGVAALARLGMGAARESREALGTWKPAALYEPRLSASEADERLRAWRRVAEAAAELSGPAEPGA
jgi:glycerol kinase